MLDYRALLLDLDGTLIDHFPTIQRCLSIAAVQVGLKPPTLDQVRGAVGGGIYATMRKLYSEVDAQSLERAYPPVWEAHLLEGVQVLPTVDEALRKLRDAGVRLAVFTNKHGPSARRLCEHLGWNPFLEFVLGADDSPWRKPAAEFSRLALEKMGVPANQVALVGDSTYDADAARVIGMDFIGVLTGTHGAAELKLAGAREIFPTLLQLQSCLGRQESVAP